LEPVNRVVYGLFDLADRGLIEPATDLYVIATPEPIRIGVSNFFENASYLDTVLNDFLQGKYEQGLSDLGRFVVNTTLGIGGLFDVASDMGLEDHEEDFGQTLGVWGAGEGAYLFIPPTGPSTIRDAFAIPVAWATNPLSYVTDAFGYPLMALRVLDTRARLKTATRVRDEAALDPYVFTREAYRQRRQFLIYDGNPPLPELEDELDALLDEEMPLEETEERPSEGEGGDDAP
jgi:ABC-type transporter lipoprotein component MlaA